MRLRAAFLFDASANYTAYARHAIIRTLAIDRNALHGLIWLSQKHSYKGR